jgi:lysozyme
MSTLQSHMQNNVNSGSRFDSITDPMEYKKELHNMIRENLQSGGFISPTEGITVKPDDSSDSNSFLSNMTDKVFKFVGAKGGDSDNMSYQKRRFQFIANEEGYKESVYQDSLGRRTIGYGFNLDEETNKGLAMRVLGLSDEDYAGLLDGTKTVSSRQARTLFEAAVGQAEKLVNTKFKDTGLRANQRLALVSLAYNHPNLIGPNLTKAVQSGDWNGAVSEIRDRSNKYKIDGIAQRRRREADLFANNLPDSNLNDNHITNQGVYTAGVSPSGKNITAKDKIGFATTFINGLAETLDGVNPLGFLIGTANASEAKAKTTLEKAFENPEKATKLLKLAVQKRGGDSEVGSWMLTNMVRNLSNAVGVSTSLTTYGMERFIRPMAEAFNIDIGKSGPVTEDAFSLDDKVAVVALADRAKARGDGGFNYQDYGTNRRGVKIGTIVGADKQIGASDEDSKRTASIYSKDVLGQLRLAFDAWTDPMTNVALTLGGASFFYTPEGDLVIPYDKYDAQRFKKGSGSSAGAYKQHRDEFNQFGATEGDTSRTPQAFSLIIPAAEVEKYRKLGQHADFLNN